MSIGARAKLELVRVCLAVLDVLPARLLLGVLGLLRRARGTHSAALLSAARRATSRLAVRAAAPAHTLPLTDDTVLYEAYHGASVTCHPEAIFRHLLADPARRHLHHVWVLASVQGTTAIEREFAHDTRVRFVEHRSREYFEALHTSRYLVNNSTFPADFTKQSGQIYLNTWHGVPLKKMGFDLPGGAANTGNVTRNLLSADYLLSSSAAETRKLWAEAFRLQGLYSGVVLETGSPRVDIELDPARAEVTREALEARGVAFGSGPVIVYAPTWRGTFSEAPTLDVDTMVAATAGLRAALGDLGATVLLRVHQFVYPHIVSDPRLAHLVVPPDTGANELLSLADVLVTDYSSIFFDYLPLDRPICFYASDLQRYTRERGVYIPVEEWPGPLSETVEDLAAHVREALSADPYSQRRRTWAQTWSCRQDGNATTRVVDAVFGPGARRDSDQVSLTDGRARVLILAGGRLIGRARRGLGRLVSGLDPARFDVTVYVRPGAGARLPRTVTDHARVIESVRPLIHVPPGSEARHAFGDQQFETVVAYRLRSAAERAVFDQVKTTRRLRWTRGRVVPVPTAR